IRCHTLLVLLVAASSRFWRLTSQGFSRRPAPSRYFPRAACDEAPAMPPAFCLEGGAPRRALPSAHHGALACRLQRLVVPRASDQCFS
ncbi:unnamed protein product, partial [Closterium sp. NIES-64]